MKRLFMKTAYAFLLSIGLITSAQSITFGVSAGLDDDTIRLIDRLPDEIRVAILKTLQDALPMLDQHVNQYIDKINASFVDTTSKTIDKFTCNVPGAIADVKAETWNDVLNGLFGKTIRFPNGEPPVPHPIAELSASIKALHKSLNANSTTDEITTKYADVLLHAAYVRCQAVAMSATSSLATIDARANELTPMSVEWSILSVSQDCHDGDDTSYECLSNRRAELDTFLATRDKRDIDAVKARELTSKLGDLPAGPTFTQRHFGAFYDVKPTEKELLAIRGIERAVVAAQRLREQRAADNWNCGISDVTPMRASVIGEVGNINQDGCHRVDYNALINERKAKYYQRFNNMQTCLTKAAELDARYEPAFKRVASYVAILKNVMDKNIASADMGLKARVPFCNVPKVAPPPPVPDLSAQSP